MTSPLGLIRPIVEDDLGLMLSWRNAPEVRRHMYTRHEISLAEHQAWWARTRERSDQRYFIYEFQGAPLGVVGFTAVDPVNQNASWAFYAAPDAPRGTGSRMEFLALDFAFAELGLHKLYCEVLASNPAVVRLHQKFGFQHEGVFRQQHRYESTFIDVHRLGILVDEWKQGRDAMLERLQHGNR